MQILILLKLPRTANKLRTAFLAGLVFWCLTAAWAVTPNAEYRAMWVTRFELTNPDNIPVIVQKAASSNFNALFVQVCGRGTAFWDSQIIPRDDRATTYDALAILITEAKKNNIEVHAWVNAFYVWSDKQPPRSQQHVVNQHPEWLTSAVFEKAKGSNNKYLDPTIPQVRDHVKAIYLEIVRKYDVAGVHLDYIRLPGPEYGYSDLARKDFEQRFGIDPLPLFVNRSLATKLYGQALCEKYQTDWNNYRTEAVSGFVHDLYQDILKIKPKVKLTAAVIADPEKALAMYFQDWPTWLTRGYIDIIVPMAYSTDDKIVEKEVGFAAEAARKSDRMVLIGLGAWRKSAQNIADNINFVRNIREKFGFPQVAGVVLFSYDRIGAEKDYLPELKRSVFLEPTARPELSYDKTALEFKEIPQKKLPEISDNIIG